MMDSILTNDEVDGKIARGITEIDLESPNFNMLEQYATVQQDINILPTKLSKKIIKNLKESCCDSTVDIGVKTHSEEMMKHWVNEFTNQIDEIDKFY